MKSLCALFMVFLFSSTCAHAAPPTLALEQQIAERQGVFGAYYVRCGSQEERGVVAGNLEKWREEVLRGYLGSAEDRRAMISAFDRGVEVVSKQASCADWIKKATAEWTAIIQLSQYGHMRSAGNL